MTAALCRCRFPLLLVALLAVLCAGPLRAAASSGYPREAVVWSLDFEGVQTLGGLESARIDSKKPAVEMGIVEEARDGAGALHLRAPAGQERNNRASLSIGRFSVEPGEAYVITYWVRAKDLKIVSGNQPHVSCKAVGHAEGGGMDWDTSSYWFANFPDGTYDWRRVSKRFKAKPDQDTVFASVGWRNASGEAWIDDAKLVRADAFEAREAGEQRIGLWTGDEHPRRHFARGRSLDASVRAFNWAGDSADGTLDVSLRGPHGSTLRQWSKEIRASPRSRTARTYAIDTRFLAFGEYTLEANWRAADGGRLAEASRTITINKRPDEAFFFGVRTASQGSAEQTRQALRTLKRHNLNPAEGETPRFMDLAMAFERRFVIGETGPHGTAGDWAARSARRGPKGQGWPNPWSEKKKYDKNFLGLSNPEMWSAAAEELADHLAAFDSYPAYYPYFITSDDFSSRAGWDWSKHNRRRFKKRHGIEAPVPPAMQNQHPTKVRRIDREPGIVPADDPWLLWNTFLLKDVHGGYNTALQKRATEIDPDVRFGQVPGGMQWPLFNVSSGLYPPHIFGEKRGFRLVSYYSYQHYWQPNLVYLYWSEIGRMGNRGLPQLVMPDLRDPEPAYLRNTFFMLLAAGVDAINYFNYSWAKQGAPYTWRAAEKNGAIANRYGKLLVRLEPDDYRVGFLSSLSTTSFRTHYPLDAFYPYANLLQAHVDAEPIAEEEILAGRLEQYETLVLSRISHLRRDVAKEIRAFARNGGTVLVDQASSDEIANLGTELPIGLISGKADSTGGNTKAYGHLDRIEAVHKAIRAHSTGSFPVSVSDPYVVARRFEAAGVDYLWLVDTHTAEEYQWLRKQYWDTDEKNWQQVRQYLGKRGAYDETKQVRVTLSGYKQGLHPHNVLTGEPIRREERSGATELGVAVPRFGGALVALYPDEPGAMRMTGPSEAHPGQSLSFEVSLSAGGHPAVGLRPVGIVVERPDGTRSAYSRPALAEDGRLTFKLEIAQNDPTGEWTITVRERSTGRRAARALRVTEP